MAEKLSTYIPYIYILNVTIAVRLYTKHSFTYQKKKTRKENIHGFYASGC